MELATILITVAVVGVSFLIAGFAIRSIMRATGPIKNGVPATALLRGFSETGSTISAPNIGPEAPVYRLDLLVSPPAGTPYAVESKQAVPRIVLPFFVPGITVPVDIDPTRSDRVKVNWQRFDAGAARGSVQMGYPTSDGEGVNLSFVDGKPVDGLDDVVTAVRTGAMPTTYGSAAELLVRGTRGTAVVTTAMPLGKRVRDVNPGADPHSLDDPLWLFTLEVTLPGQAPFPAVFGHRVPQDRLASLAPGITLPVAVNLANPTQECAIDWATAPR